MHFTAQMVRNPCCTCDIREEGKNENENVSLKFVGLYDLNICRGATETELKEIKGRNLHIRSEGIIPEKFKIETNLTGTSPHHGKKSWMS